jgi:hypothetical protein
MPPSFLRSLGSIRKAKKLKLQFQNKWQSAGTRMAAVSCRRRGFTLKAVRYQGIFIVVESQIAVSKVVQVKFISWLYRGFKEVG